MFGKNKKTKLYVLYTYIQKYLKNGRENKKDKRNTQGKETLGLTTSTVSWQRNRRIIFRKYLLEQMSEK